MKVAYPIDHDGQRVGPNREFTDEVWARLSGMPNLRWILTSGEPEKIQKVEEVPDLPEEIEEILPEKDPVLLKEDLSWEDLQKMTKKEIIEHYGFSMDDMKLTKAELIKKI